MNQPITSKINEKGHLEVGGCDLVDLAVEFGTPLYVMDETTLRGKCREYRTAFKNHYDNTLILYASKALCNTAILKIVQDEGLGVDVASGGELYTARKAGCDLKTVYFHGNNKTQKELLEAVEMEVGRIVVDNFNELEILDRLTQKVGKKMDILFRVNPGIEAHTHEFIQTGQLDSKFGISKERIAEAVKLANKTKYVNFIGLHAHIGSQIFDVKPYLSEIEVLCELSAASPVEEIDIGGGLGIDYSGSDEVPTLEQFAEEVVGHFKKCCERNKLGEPRLILEPGRSIVGNAGVTLYTVGGVKEIPGIRKYVSVDGGMADNPRPVLYDAQYSALLVNKARKPAVEKVTIAGRFCESGDKLIKDIELPKVEAGDTLAVLATGAYNYSMASNYNRVGRPAMVLINSGTPTLILKRESYEDLTQNDVVM